MIFYSIRKDCVLLSMFSLSLDWELSFCSFFRQQTNNESEIREIDLSSFFYFRPKKERKEEKVMK